MPASHLRSAPLAPQVEALGAKWTEALRSGGSPESLAAEARNTPGAAATVRILGSFAGPNAVGLLSQLALFGPPDLALAAAEGLGDVRDDRSVAALDTIARQGSDRSVQKAARRSLHRLAHQAQFSMSRRHRR